MALTPALTIECFHLAFLSVLPGALGPSGYVLKGGANLRYFFASERYSEDIDLDLVRLQAWQVKEKVDRALESQNLSRLLRTAGLLIEDFSAPKQTDTTQRWKVAVGRSNGGGPVRTKIEFSHRELDPRHVVEPVPDEVVAAYALRPPVVQHYRAEAAIDQKIGALAGRSETQARDVFDLELLFRRHGQSTGQAEDPATRELARDRAIEMPYEAFRDQVLPFLEPEAAELIGDPGSWERIQTFVAENLERT